MTRYFPCFSMTVGTLPVSDTIHLPVYVRYNKFENTFYARLAKIDQNKSDAGMFWAAKINNLMSEFW